MKLTVEQIDNAMNALVNIGTRQGVRIPQMAAFKLKQMHDIIKPHYEEVDRVKKELVIKYGEEHFYDAEKTKPSGEWKILDPEKMKGFSKEWDAFKAEEVEVNVKPVSIVLFGNGDHGLDMKELVLLGPLVEEPKE